MSQNLLRLVYFVNEFFLNYSRLLTLILSQHASVEKKSMSNWITWSSGERTTHSQLMLEG